LFPSARCFAGEAPERRWAEEPERAVMLRPCLAEATPQLVKVVQPHQGLAAVLAGRRFEGVAMTR
jgi:hypothetical protein